MEKNYSTQIDSLEMLLGEQSVRHDSSLKYYILWIKTVLEQDINTGQAEILDEIANRLSEKFKKPTDDEENYETQRNDYVYSNLLIYICMKETLNFGKAFKALYNVSGYLEYTSISASYVTYAMGRLLYDIQEFYDDYIHLKKEMSQFLSSENIDIYLPPLSAVLPDVKGYIKEMESFVSELIERGDNSSCIVLSTQADFLKASEQLFCSAMRKKQREHYSVWLALTHQKKAVKYFQINVGECLNELNKAIEKYELTIELSNKKIVNIYFNLGVCHFYKQMFYICKDSSHCENEIHNAYNKAIDYLKRALNANDESLVKKEYTFRRSTLDVFYYSLVSRFEMAKYNKKMNKIIIPFINPCDERLKILYADASTLFAELKEKESEQRVEYYVTLAEVVDFLKHEYFTNNMSSEILNFDFWKKAKLLDEKKFQYPFRIGMAFHNLKYYKKWEEIISLFANEFNIDMNDEKSYSFFQNNQIRKHYQLEESNRINNEECNTIQ